MAITKEELNLLVQNFLKIQQDYIDLPLSDSFNEIIIHKFYQVVIHDLSAILLDKNLQLEAVETALQEFLANYRQLTAVNLLSPTAIPTADITLFMCKLALVVCGDKQPVEMLFEGVQWEAIKDPYCNLDKSIPLEHIIQTHIISDDAKTLIPVHCVTEDKFVFDMYVNDTRTMAHYNPYDNSYVKEILGNEAKRLVEHSEITRELYSAFGRYHELVRNNATDLYSQLDRLCRMLKIEDAHNGRGTQEKAGEGAFTAIVQFGIFFQRLPKEQKDQVPANVMNAINHLLRVSSDYDKNGKRMVDRIETCAGQRREQIEAAMQGKEKILATICLEPGLIEKHKLEALTQAETIINDLKQQFQQGKYQRGHDNLGFNKKILEKLNLKFSVANARDLELFYKLSTIEMEELLTNNNQLQDEIVHAVNSLENLIIVTHSISMQKLECLLKILSGKLNAKYVGSREDYLALIITHYKQEFICILDFYFGSKYTINNNILEQEQYNTLMQWRSLKTKLVNDINKKVKNDNIDNALNILDDINNEFIKMYAYGIYISDSGTINTEIIQQFFKAGIHPSSKDRNGNTLFYRAAENEWQTSSYSRLIEISAETKKLSIDDWTRALTDYLRVVKTSNPKIIINFIEVGASPLAKTINNQNVFQLAKLDKWSKEQSAQLFQTIFENENLSAENLAHIYSGYIESAAILDVDICIKFLELGVHPLTKNEKDETLFQRAHKGKWKVDDYLKLLELVIKSNKLSAEELNHVYSDYISCSVSINNAAIKLYFTSGVNPLTKDCKNHSLFYRAAVNNWTEEVYLKLINYAVDTNKLTAYDFSCVLSEYLEGVGTDISKDIVLSLNLAKAAKPVEIDKIPLYADASTQTESSTEALIPTVEPRVADYQNPFKPFINDLINKRNELKERNTCLPAVLTLTILIENLDLELIHVKGEDEGSKQRMKNCLHHIREARPVLNNHRGNHPLIMHTLNILAKICSLLVSIITLGAAPYISGKNPFRLFPYFETDTSRKLHDFEDYIQLDLRA